MIKKNFIDKLIWSIILSVAVMVLLIFSVANKNFNWLNVILIAIFSAVDAYFIVSTIKFCKYLNYEKIALSKGEIATATYMDKKVAYKFGDFKNYLITEIYKIQFSWINELGELVIDESLAIFTKEQVENLANRGTFNVFIAHEKKAVVIYDKI